MKQEKELDTRENLRVVTTNDFITAKGLDKISLKARKLFYIAIVQCKQNDEGFYAYRISVKEMASLMGIDPSNLYQEIESITDELSTGYIKVKAENGTNFINYQIFSMCSKIDKEVTFELNNRMTDFLLGIKKDFTKPLLNDFLKMNSKYSMAIWHLIQREMKSKKPYGSHIIEFNLSLSELRQVTGTEEKLTTIGNFKNRILDKALREIKDNCNVDIKYTNIKEGKNVIGFHFTAYSPRYIEPEQFSQSLAEKIKSIDTIIGF